MAKRGRKKGTKKFIIGGQEVYLSPAMQAQHGFQKKRGRPPKLHLPSSLGLLSHIDQEARTVRHPMVFQAEHVPTLRGIGAAGRRRGRPKGSKNKPKSISKLTKAQLIKLVKGM